MREKKKSSFIRFQRSELAADRSALQDRDLSWIFVCFFIHSVFTIKVQINWLQIIQLIYISWGNLLIVFVCVGVASCSGITCMGLPSSVPIMFLHSMSDLCSVSRPVSQSRTYPPISTVTTPPEPWAAISTSLSETLDNQLVYGDAVIDLSITDTNVK